MLTAILIFCLVLLLVRLLIELYDVCNLGTFIWHNQGSQWAVITGGTDGIGFEFARQFALRGYHLKLLSRNEEKLAITKQAILTELSNKNPNYKVEIQTLAVDFIKPDIFEKIEEFVAPKTNDIFILVNNVGAAPEIPDYFVNEDRGLHSNIINVNVVTTTKMIEMILPSMVEKKRGLVICVSAIWARHLAPLWAVHAASKAYIGQLCEILGEETRQAGITFRTLYTGGVSTKMAHNIQPSAVVPSAAEYVKSVLSSVHKRSTHSTGHWAHELGHQVFSAVSLIGTRRAIALFLHWFSRKYRALLLERQLDSELEITAWNLLKANASR